MSKQDQLDKLKLHFGRRVHEQARSVVNGWINLREVHWSADWFAGFAQACSKLHKLAQRYDFETLAVAAAELNQLLAGLSSEKAPPSQVLEHISKYIDQVAEACARAHDELPSQQMTSGRKPVYLCMVDGEQAQILQQQLEHFAIPAQYFASAEDMEKAMSYRLPAAIVADIDFDNGGINMISQLQGRLREPMPVLFFSAQEPTVEIRLKVVRANGVVFFTEKIDFGVLVERLMDIYALRSEPPYRVLVVDDSRSQSLYAEKSLNKAGIFTRSVNNPLAILDEIGDFHPDAILMDMYMPGCMGTEIAQVVRQQSRFDAIPILYLSAESDLEKQLEALGEVGDDFLTKPVPPTVLITTIMNRCQRHRRLRDQMIRDSLTGLVDHNNVLEALKDTIAHTVASGAQVSFVMIDIDRFKMVNDTYGHAMGDRIIHSLALFLRQRFRVSDTIGRYGGEEFAIVLPDTNESTAALLLDDVRASFAKLTHHQGDHEISVTFSCGVAGWRRGEDASKLAQRADEALYRAKYAGRNQVCRAAD